MRRVAITTMPPRCVFGALSTLTACSGGTTIHAATPVSGVTFNQKYLCATRSISVSANRTSAMTNTSKKHPLDELKRKFGDESWKTFEEKMPEWAGELKNYSADTLCNGLQQKPFGYSFVEASSVATALVEYFNKTGDGTLSFKEGGQWPRLDDPASTLDFKPDECLKFVAQDSNSGDWCLESEMKTRMVRRHYRLVWERLQAVEKAGEHMLIMGNAGIGKSLLLDLLLSWSLFTRPDVPVVVMTVRGVEIFCKDGDAQKHFVILWKDYHPQNHIQRLIDKGILAEGERMLVLHDIKTANDLPFKSGEVVELKRFFKITCVVASSPLESNHVRFTKDYATTTLVLPPLSHDEAKVLVQHQQGAAFDEATFEDWFDKVGGVPRHLRSAKAVSSAAGAQVAAAQTVRFDPASTATSRESGKVVAMRSDPLNLERPYYDFISQNAWREWRKRQETTAAPELLKQLREAQVADIRDVYGRYFESWFLRLLERGEVLCRQRVVGKTLHCVKRWELPNDSSSLKTTRFWSKSAAVIKPADDPTLYIPLDSNFPVVDAVVAWKTSSGKNYASVVQVTVAESHKPKSSATRELLAALDGNGFDEWDFTWVVDPQSKLASSQDVDGASVDGWSKVPQYICRIDDLMCWVCEKGSTKPTTSSVSFPLRSDSADAILREVKERVNPDAISITNIETIGGPCSMGTPYRYSTKKTKKKTKA